MGALFLKDALLLRVVLSALTAFLVTLISTPYFIRWLKQQKIGQVIREDGPEVHSKKAGTPTMGGVIILLAILVSALLWGDLTNRFIDTLLLLIVSFGVIGGIDDYKKLVLKDAKGLPARWKYILQSAFGLLAAMILYFTATASVDTQLVIPFLKDVLLPLGILYPIWAYFVIVGSSNAVNLTDGLDGLAILPVALVAAALGVFAYLSGSVQWAYAFTTPYIMGVDEVAVLCSAILGSGLGFLWFNAYPAEVFMGDVGSLSLGAALGGIALAVRQELLLVIMGGIFVAETFSVILQVAYFKFTKGKRIFEMTPLHHHFELKGWPEMKIVTRFWIITCMLVLLGLVSLW